MSKKRLGVNRLTPLVQSWEAILADIQRVLEAEANIDQNSASPEVVVEEMIRVLLPALSQRLCELASRIGPTAGDTSACVMVCHKNDRDAGVLSLRVAESFPSYGLDRIVNSRNGRWNLHLRYVHYADFENPSVNNDIVAQALIKGRDVHGYVNAETNTPSESQQEIVAIHACVPYQIKTIEDVANLSPGVIVAANIDYYNTEPDGRSVFESIQRVNVIKDILSELHAISKINMIGSGNRKEFVKRALSSVDGAGVASFTLKEMARRIVGMFLGGG